MSFVKVMTPWFLAFRPKTLTAAIIPILVGTALANRYSHQVHWASVWWALCSSLFIQMGTNLFNDVIDCKKGADNENRLGPQRVTQSGLISSRLVFWGGCLSFVLAVCCGIPLLMRGGEMIAVIGLISLVCGYVYTGGPYPLAYHGWGDVFVVIFFGWVAVGGVFFLHTGTWIYQTLIAGTQVGFLATVLIAINNFRDMEQDRLVKKQTLAVRWGPCFARWEIRLLLVISLILSVYWWEEGCWAAAVGPCFLIPFIWILINQIDRQPPGPVYNRFLAQAGLIHCLFGILLSLGLAIT